MSEHGVPIRDRCQARPDRRCCPHVGLRRMRCCHCGAVLAPVGRAEKPKEPRKMGG